MTLIRRFFSGPSLMQAVLAAARHYEVDPEDLVYEVIDKKHGFLKTPRGVVIEVDPDQPAKVAAPESAAPPPPESVAPPAPDAPLHRLEALTDPVAPDQPTPEQPTFESQEAAAPDTPAPGATAHAGPAGAAPDDAMPADSRLTDAVTPPPGRPLPGAPSSDSEPPSPSAQRVDAERSSSQTEPVADAPLPSPEPMAAASSDAAPSADGASSAEAPEANWWDSEPAAPEPHGVEPGGDERAAVEAPSAELPGAGPASPGADAVPLDADLQSAVAQAVDELVYLAGLRVQVASAVEVDDGLTIEIEGPDSRRVVAHGGRALLAIQHLLPRLLFNRLGRAVHCRLDCEGFHAARGERLERLARKAADRVRSGGRSWLLEPMAPDERRLVHLALADEPDVETESVGEGYLKRVRVAQI